MTAKNMFAKVSIKKPEPPKDKTVSVTVQFEMDEKTAKLFLQSSIERVINTSVQMIEKVEEMDNDVAFPYSTVNLEDWQEWKPVICSLWNSLHDAIFRKLGGLPDNERVYTLQKGD